MMMMMNRLNNNPSRGSRNGQIWLAFFCFLSLHWFPATAAYYSTASRMSAAARKQIFVNPLDVDQVLALWRKSCQAGSTKASNVFCHDPSPSLQNSINEDATSFKKTIKYQYPYGYDEIKKQVIFIEPPSNGYKHEIQVVPQPSPKTRIYVLPQKHKHTYKVRHNYKSNLNNLYKKPSVYFLKSSKMNKYPYIDEPNVHQSTEYPATTVKNIRRNYNSDFYRDSLVQESTKTPKTSKLWQTLSDENFEESSPPSILSMIKAHARNYRKSYQQAAPRVQPNRRNLIERNNRSKITYRKKHRSKPAVVNSYLDRYYPNHYEDDDDEDDDSESYEYDRNFEDNLIEETRIQTKRATPFYYTSRRRRRPERRNTFEIVPAIYRGYYHYEI